MDELRFEPDELAGFERATISLPREDDGELVATLVARPGSTVLPEKRAVLYLHGYVDYFFHPHVAEAFEGAGFSFYALDLRRYGRSLRPDNVPCQCRAVDDYFPELDRAIEHIESRGATSILLVAHSTGGLIGSIYRKRGRLGARLRAVVLNSPFFEFRANPVERAALVLVKKLGESAPTMPAPVGLESGYGKTLHVSESGEWNYDLRKKPLPGFGVTCGWLSAVGKGHAEIQAGLDLDCPVLVLHSTKSHRPGRVVRPEDHGADLVLDVRHMVQFAPRVGPHVEIVAVENGLHDLTLSRPETRNFVLDKMTSFATRVCPPPA